MIARSKAHRAELRLADRACGGIRVEPPKWSEGQRVAMRAAGYRVQHEVVPYAELGRSPSPTGHTKRRAWYGSGRQVIGAQPPCSLGRRAGVSNHYPVARGEVLGLLALHDGRDGDPQFADPVP